jgi:hypothetical protein
VAVKGSFNNPATSPRGKKPQVPICPFDIRAFPFNRRLGGPQAGVGALGKIKISLPCLNRNLILRSSSPQLSHYTNYAISNPKIPQCANIIAYTPVKSPTEPKTSTCILPSSRKSLHRLFSPLCRHFISLHSVISHTGDSPLDIEFVNKRQYSIFLFPQPTNLLQKPNLNFKVTHAV